MELGVLIFSLPICFWVIVTYLKAVKNAIEKKEYLRLYLYGGFAPIVGLAAAAGSSIIGQIMWNILCKLIT